MAHWDELLGRWRQLLLLSQSSEQWVRRAPGLVTLSMELLFMAWGVPKVAEQGTEPSGQLSPFLG